jgi:hypothetical protein
MRSSVRSGIRSTALSASPQHHTSIERKKMSHLKIVGMGYRGILPGDKKRQDKAVAKARKLLELAEAAEKRGKK